jgi:hypothetical protein
MNCTCIQGSDVGQCKFCTSVAAERGFLMFAWTWIKHCFSLMFGKPSSEVKSLCQDNPTDEEPVINQPVDIRGVFTSTIQEACKKKQERELELLNDVILSQYIRKTIEYMIERLNNNSGSILIGYRDIECNLDSWSAFKVIFHNLATEMGMKLDKNSTYISIESNDLMLFIDKMKNNSIDTDERTRAMLGRGIYR